MKGSVAPEPGALGWGEGMRLQLGGGAVSRLLWSFRQEVLAEEPKGEGIWVESTGLGD